MRRLPQLTYANLTSSIALFVALGGTSYAVIKLPRNSVGSQQVRNGSLKRVDLARNARTPGPRGPRGTQGPVGPRGPSGVWFAPQRDALTLPASKDTPLEVRRIAGLPAGSWELKFTSDVVGTLPGVVIAYCRFVINGEAQGFAGVVVGQSPSGVQQAGLHLDTVVTSATPFAAIVSCAQDQAGSPPPTISGAQIVATQVADVTKAP